MANNRNNKQSENEILSSYLQAIDKIPLLSYEEEYELALKAKNGDKKSREKLANSNLRFVVSIAKKYRGQGMSLEDLISEGNIGLLTAIDKFEPEKGYHFISYGVWWIRQSILKALAEQGRPVRLPLNRSNEMIQINRAKNYLIHEEGITNPSYELISQKCGLDLDTVKNLLTISREMISFDSPLSNDEDDDSNLSNFVEDSSQSPEEDMISEMMKNDVNSLLSILSEKERDIINKRYGFCDNEPMSLKAIGDEYNLTKERIRQIEKGALEKIKKNGSDIGLEYYNVV